MAMNRFGLIDVGSNTIKILIGQKDGSLSGKILDQQSLPCRLLSMGTQDEPEISLDALNRLVVCVNELKERMKKWEVKQVRMVGTEALRKSKNSSWVIKELLKSTGLLLEIISGEEEAQAVADGLRTDPILKNWESFMALDIGGGSLEMIECRKGKTIQSTSLPLGAIALAKLSGVDLQKPLGIQNAEKLRSEISKSIKHEAPKFHSSDLKLAGCGGTLVFLRLIIEETHQNKGLPVLSRTEIDHYFEKTAAISLKERIARFPKLPADRADVFPFGLLGISCAMQYLGQSRITHSFHNLRHGLIFNHPK